VVAALPASTRLIASAMTAERRSVERLASYRKLSGEVERHRVAPLLARVADELATSGSCVEGWRTAAEQSIAESQKVSSSLASLAAKLQEAGVRWAPLAGADLATRVYQVSSDRPLHRLEILVATRDLDPAIQACAAAGWRAEDSGEGRGRALREEGSTWRARAADGHELRLYFRLWPWTPEYMLREAFERAEPAPELGDGAVRLGLVDTYLIAAQRVWTQPARRSLIHWWDLHRIVDSGGAQVGREAYREARRAGLHLPVGLAGAVAAGLWGHAANRQLADLLRELRGWERAALVAARTIGAEKAPAWLLLVARQLTGRSTRGGWRSVIRPLWAHAGVVEDESPESWPAFLRRPRHLVVSLGRCLRGRKR
jgi:hypothetical protein